MRSSIAILSLIAVLLLVYACGGGSSEASSTTPPQSMIADEPTGDPKGVGEVREVALTNPLDKAMLEKGKAVYELKCAACHKLTDQRVVGPGFKGIMSRRTPEWIMNMILNVDVMLEEDPAARLLLEECLVRMPNQNLNYDDARGVLEFMRQNDGEI